MDSDPYANEAEILERLARKLRGIEEPSTNGHRSTLDWHESFAKDFREDWLISGFWPWGRSLHIFSEAKTGKSLLMLWCAANIAMGRDPFTHRPIEAQRVLYVDKEMTEQDVIERVNDMNFKPDQLENLRYALYPDIAPLDTPKGGMSLLRLMDEEQCDICMLDTLSRVVQGEENSNDTYQAFHTFTGSLLKANGKTMARLDHEGKVKGTSRGASSKADDVDLLYSLAKIDVGNSDSGLVLKEFKSRIKGNRKEIRLEQGDDPVSFKTTVLDAWNVGVREKARELDSINAPIDITRRQAQGLLEAMGIAVGKTTTLNDAVRYRKERLPLLGN